MTCTHCAPLRESHTFASPAQLERAAEAVRASVAEGIIVPADYKPPGQVWVVQPPFEKLRPDSWPDAYAYYFRCPRCSALYAFTGETYHGGGGRWQPVEIAT